MRHLVGLGVSPLAEDVYICLVERGRQPVAAIAAWLGEGPAVVTSAVAELEALGIVAVAEEGVEPLPPRAAIETLAATRAREAEAARAGAASLGELWAAHVEGPPYVEMLTTTAAVMEATLAIHDTAVSEVCALSIGPLGRVDMEPAVAPGCMEALGRGVGYRVLYGARILQQPLAMAAVSKCIAAGEVARVFPDVPLNLTLGETYAIVMIGAPGTERLHGMVVHPSDLRDSLTGIFEAFWGLGVPISPTGDAVDHRGVDPSTTRLLTYLGAGLTDESIARELGVSERTAARRVAALQQALGAQTRFQLGVQAVRRGWL